MADITPSMEKRTRKVKWKVRCYRDLGFRVDVGMLQNTHFLILYQLRSAVSTSELLSL